jgi:exo-beta-1,3-glucanase (GH17 family)
MNAQSRTLCSALLLLVVALSAPVAVAQSEPNTSFLPAIAKDGPTPTPTETPPLPPLSTPGPHFPLSYGPYRPGQSPGGATPSPAEIAEDLDILKAETNLIRTYGSCGELAVIPPLARQRVMYLVQGIWLSDNSAANRQELACYAQLVAENDNLHGTVTGSEVLLRNDLSASQLAVTITQTRQLADIPVSTGETWAKWCDLRAVHPRCPGLPLLRENVDFTMIHVHPYWEALPIEHAAAHVVAVQIYVNTTYTGTAVIIGETGWPTCGATVGNAEPGVANQRRFVEELWKWSNLYGIRVVFFEAFDEPWKASPGREVEGCWGLYNADRTPKHPVLDWSMPTPEATPTAPAVRIDHPSGDVQTVTKGNCGAPVFGQVFHAGAGWQVQIEVFTNAWYIQDKWYANGRAPVINGKWAMPEAVLAGQGMFNNHRVRATLLDDAGSAIASDEVSGIVRANPCSP